MAGHHGDRSPRASNELSGRGGGARRRRRGASMASVAPQSLSEPGSRRPVTSRTVSRWDDLSDEELAQRCAAQVAGSMEELLRRHEGTIRQCARRMAIRPDHAEDLAQEILVRVVASLPRFEGRSAFTTWLYRLAHNTCIDDFRRELRRSGRAAAVAGDPRGQDELLEDLPADWGDPVAELDAQIQECYLGWVLSGLPPKYREVIRLRLVEGRSTEEVAGELGTTVDAVKARLRRARRRLSDDLASAQACPYCGRTGAYRATDGRLE